MARALFDFFFEVIPAIFQGETTGNIFLLVLILGGGPLVIAGVKKWQEGRVIKQQNMVHEIKNWSEKSIGEKIAHVILSIIATGLVLVLVLFWLSLIILIIDGIIFVF